MQVGKKYPNRLGGHMTFAQSIDGGMYLNRINRFIKIKGGSELHFLNPSFSYLS